VEPQFDSLPPLIFLVADYNRIADDWQVAFQDGEKLHEAASLG
jgi:hypothetical protein